MLLVSTKLIVSLLTIRCIITYATWLKILYRFERINGKRWFKHLIGSMVLKGLLFPKHVFVYAEIRYENCTSGKCMCIHFRPWRMLLELNIKRQKQSKEDLFRCSGYTTMWNIYFIQGVPHKKTIKWTKLLKNSNTYKITYKIWSYLTHKQLQK